MSTIIHKTFGINKKKGLHGFQFNFPYEGCVFDKTRQVYAEYKRGLTDKELLQSLYLEFKFFSRMIKELNWKDIRQAEEFFMINKAK